MSYTKLPLVQRQGEHTEGIKRSDRASKRCLDMTPDARCAEGPSSSSATKVSQSGPMSKQSPADESSRYAVAIFSILGVTKFFARMRFVKPSSRCFHLALGMAGVADENLRYISQRRAVAEYLVKSERIAQE